MKELKEELDKIIIKAIEDTIKVADKYGLDRNETVNKMAEKIYVAATIGDYSGYKCKEESIKKEIPTNHFAERFNRVM